MRFAVRAAVVATLLCFTWPVAAEELKSGLVGQYFSLSANPGESDAAPANTKPFLVRVDRQINFPLVNGQFYGTKLSDHFLVRWNGKIRIAKPGVYEFLTESDDGSRLYINGTKVVENWGAHSPERKAGTIELAAGDHDLLVTYNEGGVGAACIVRWTPPGAGENVVPAEVLFHTAEQAKVDWNQVAWKRNARNRRPAGGVPFDFKKWGPFVGAAVNLGEDTQGDNIAFRGIIIRLDEPGDACVVFDGDTMRMAAGWTDGGLVLEGLPFTSGHGTFPRFEGEALFRTRVAPGWGTGTSVADPRQSTTYPPLGPLPKTWAHYEGLYLHGNRITLKYSVGKSQVLESPSLAKSPEGDAIVRSFQIENNSEPLTLVLADAPKDATKIDGQIATISEQGGDELSAVGIGNLPTNAKLAVRDELLVLELPAGQGVTKFNATYWNGTSEDLAKVAPKLTASETPNFAELTKAGPAHWTEEITTKGQLSTNDDSAYVLDRITVPYQNPYGSQMRIGGLDFFKDGTTAAVCTWDGEIWLVSGIDDKLENVKWKRFATGLHEPLGLRIVDEKIYAVSDDQITRFHDTNNDGEADYYENFNNDWELTSGFHAFCFDLQNDPAGNFIFAFGSPVQPGGRSFERMGKHHGKILRVSKDGSQLEIYASGLRAPNGIGVSPTGQITTGDNEGTFVPRCPINWVKEKQFLGVADSAENYDALKTTPTVADRRGNRAHHLELAEMPKPLAWLPKNVDNSGGGQIWVTSDRWGPLANELLHMSYGQSALYLVMKEDKAGQMQGGVTKLPLRFTSSAMRARFNPRDGQLYVAGLRGWQTNAANDGGFDRVRYTGKKVYMPVSLRVKKNGIEIQFSEKLDEDSAADPDNYSVTGSDIQWTHSYGSSDYRVGQRDLELSKWKQGSTEFYVEDAQLLDDGKTVFLEIEDFQPVHQMNIKLDVEAADGTPIKTDIWNTVHTTE